MIKRVLIGILAFLLVVSPVFACDLSSFPDMFLDGARIVVGRAADPEDVLGAVDVAVALQQRMGNNRRIDKAMMDPEVEDLTSQNTIVVGGPCINSLAAELMGYPENCLEGFEYGKGMIKLYEFENGNVALLAAGTTALDTRRVTTVLSNYDEFALNGNDMVVTGFTIKDIDWFK